MGRVALQINSIIRFGFNRNSITSFLWDPWLFGKSVMTVFPSSNLDSLIPLHAMVSDYLRDDGWLLPAVVSDTIAISLQHFKFNQETNGTLFWQDSNKACFSSFIKYYHREEAKVDWYNLVWHKHFAVKYSFYTWLAINNGLKTAEELLKRTIRVPQSCSLCFVHSETTGHLLYECDYAFSVLQNLIPMVIKTAVEAKLANWKHTENLRISWAG
ncbi:uncharacterized protein LOC110114262 [Dendrobium catenatum]|uniref:uncharacterized protein LOC110114262 n=1 Tax=Dendrobium catenatum TaxID=906689 RepID=UPI00109F0BD0|nr:uncharacterized protein LOC110114262 [Dendrobium catenatum]